jgi:O-acetyl-ADP-ribose deacetylase (regulator of RNase III)
MRPELLSRIELVRGNIVAQDVDAIVNAANETLLGGGGVDGAIHRAAGPALLEECEGIGGCPTGEARITRGHRLKAAHVIHAVGPIYVDGTKGEAERLSSAYRSSLALAERHGCRVVAFPAISTGAYGYPKAAAARIAIGTVLDWISRSATPETVRFVLFSEADLELYRSVLGAI